MKYFCEVMHIEVKDEKTVYVKVVTFGSYTKLLKFSVIRVL